ncbi:MAG: DUF2799 domain-containing protein [Bdellovibrionales bacterium]|nr:DUF2799 domain-containing protein [Bdellovibrionales bacterium]
MRSHANAILTAVLIVVAGALSTGCGSIGRVNRPTVTGDPCAQADWFEVGRLDGLQGIQEETSAYVGRCRRFLNEELYLAGWNRGLVDFCTPERAFDTGRSGLDYTNGICPPHAEPTFLRAFAKGRELLKIERENADLESQIDRLRRLLDSPDTTGMSVAPQISSDLQKLRDRRAKNEELVRSIENARRL